MNFEKITEYMESLKTRYGVRCADLKIMKGHDVIYRHLTGTADYADKIPLTEHHLHNIYSASKVLTMIAVMQLVEQGKLSLNDRLDQYLPEYGNVKKVQNFDLTEFVSTGKFLFGWPHEDTYPCVKAEHPIQIHELMSMTAGLSYELGSKHVKNVIQENPHAATREIVRAIAKNPLLYEPGTRYAYSLGHDVLAAVIEVISNRTFGEYMRRNIFEPLEMTDMFYQIPETEENRVVSLYDAVVDEKTGEKSYKEQIHNICRVTDHYESGGGGIACTVDSYIKAIEALANDGIGGTGAQILRPESIRQLSQNRLNKQQLKDFHIGGKLEYGYGLGVRTLLDPSASKSPVGEFGWDGAAGAYVLADPKNKLSLFYAQAAFESGSAFAEIHPTLRDMVYDALESEERN